MMRRLATLIGLVLMGGLLVTSASAKMPPRHGDLRFLLLDSGHQPLDGILHDVTSVITRRLPLLSTRDHFTAADLLNELNRPGSCTLFLHRLAELEDRFAWIHYQFDFPVSFFRVKRAETSDQVVENDTAVLTNSIASWTARFMGITYWEADTYQQILNTVEMGQAEDWLVIDYIPQIIMRDPTQPRFEKLMEVHKTEAWTACSKHTEPEKLRILRHTVSEAVGNGVLQTFYDRNGLKLRKSDKTAPQTLF